MGLWRVGELNSMIHPTQLMDPGNIYGFSSILADNSDQMLDLIALGDSFYYWILRCFLIYCGAPGTVVVETMLGTSMEVDKLST